MSQFNYNNNSSFTLYPTPLCKPSVPEKNFRLINGRVSSVNDKKIYAENMKSELSEYWEKKHRQLINSDSNFNCDNLSSKVDNSSETNLLSKTDSISEEFLSYIEQVHNCLNYIMAVKEQLDDEFSSDSSISRSICNVFRDIQALQSAYKIIQATVVKLMSQKSDTLYLYDVILDPVVSNLLKMYKPFLNNYGSIIKWITEFNKDNEQFEALCDRVKRDSGNMANSSLDNSLYTVFNSLFSIELMFDRYRKCFDDDSKQFKMATEAKDLISNILKLMNQNQDQESFLQTHKELSFLTGRSRESRVNTRFIIKSVVTKLSRRDDKRLSRQLVLFSDCLYVTLLPSNILGTSSVRQEMSVESLRVSEIINHSLTATSAPLEWGLTINAKEAVQDFYFDNEHTMHTWRDSLHKVINDQGRIESVEISNIATSLDSLGLEAPRWQKDSAAGYCNGHRCCQKFGTATRRHHCRADGLLYCDSCCSFKVHLDFERSQESRVCELCYHILFLYQHDNSEQLLSAKSQLQEVLNRRVHVGSKCGWMKVKTFNKDKTALLPSVKYFCELEVQDPVLKLYEMREDKYHYERIWLSEVDLVYTEGAKCFKIEDKTKTFLYQFAATNDQECLSWVKSLTERSERCVKA